MPNRILRDWTDSTRIEQLDAEAERFFIRLIMKADDFGIFHGDIRLLKAALFPLLTDTRLSSVRQWRDKCVSTGLCHLYTDERNREFLQINDFNQRTRAKESKFPKPDGHMTVICQSHDGHMLTETETETETDTKTEATPSPTQSEKPKTGSYTPCEIDLPKNLQEVVDHFERNQAPAWLAEDWHNQMESAGWVVRGTQVRKWRAAAITKIRYWEADGRPSTREKKVNANGKSIGNQQKIDRAQGTANAGLASQYAGVGLVAQD